MTTRKEKEAEIEHIYHVVLEAIPMEVCMVNVIIALNELAMEFAQEMGCGCEEDDDENDDEDDNSPIGTLPGTIFSKN